MIGLRAAIIAALLALCLGLAAGNASAEKVGVAAAVNPDAYSSLSGATEKQLRIGKSIFYNERISTDASGVVQVLLVDGSTFTVGANSDLVIDRFVYDPRKKSGEVVATFSKGAMRFIGGKISKNPEGVTVNTQPGHPRRYVPGEPRREKLNFLIPLRRRADLQRKQRPDPYGLPGLYARLQRRPADSGPV